MASKHAPTPKVGSKTPEVVRRKLPQVDFWRSKEKSPDIATSPSASSISSPPGPSQTKPINIPSAAPSLHNVQEVTPFNATAQLRTNNSNVNISASLSLAPSHSTPYSTTPTTHLYRSRTSSEAIPVSHSVPNLQNRMRTSQEGELIITNASHTNGMEPHVNKLNKSAGLYLESSAYKNSPSSSSSTPNNLSNSGSNAIKQSPTTTVRSTSLQSVQDAAPTASQLAHRRRSLHSDRVLSSEFTLQERPPKSLSKSASADEITTLLRKIQESEKLLNALETQLKTETLKRIDNPYGRELEAALKKGDGDKKTRGATEQHILDELDNFKKLEARYREVLEDVSASKDALAKMTERLSSSGTFDMPLDFNHKRRLSVKNSSSPCVSSPEAEPPKPRKTNSFNEAISNLKRGITFTKSTESKATHISRTSIKFLGPLAPGRRHRDKHNGETKHESSTSSGSETPTESDEDGKKEDVEPNTTMHAELFKQLIQQKYASRENISSPFICNLRTTWRQRVSKSDSWANKLQAGEWQEEDEDTDEVLEGSGVVPNARRRDVHSKSQNYIGIPQYNEEIANRLSKANGEIVLMVSNGFGYGNNSLDSTTNTSDDEGSTTSEITRMFARDRPAHLDQQDVGRLAETLKRRPTYQQLVSKKILRGDAIFGVSLENLIDIPEAIRMMADFIADSGALDLLDVPGIERDVLNLQNSIDAGNHSIEMMQLLPYAVGTLFTRFLQQLPEKLFSQLSPKFLWVQETEIATLRYTMFRSLIFLLVVSHRNMVAFLFKWLRKMSDDPRKLMYYTPAYLGNIFGNCIVQGSDSTKAAMATQKLIEDYKHVFLDAEPDIRHFMKDGKQLVKWATVDRLIEKVIDPNCYDEQLAPMFFFCHMYFIESKDLLEKIVGIYLKIKIGTPATWRSETCKRITNMLKLWVDSHGTALSTNEAYVSLMAAFMKSRRESADPDATEKELDRMLFYHRTQQQLARTLPTRFPNSSQVISVNGSGSGGKTSLPNLYGASGSGGKAKPLPPIMEHVPPEPDNFTLLPASAPTSPRNPSENPRRSLAQTTSAFFSRTTPPAPISVTNLNGNSKSSKKAKAPSTPVPTALAQPYPSLKSQKRLTRAPIPTAYRSNSPARPRAISNASALHNSSTSSPHNSPRNSPRNSPPTTPAVPGLAHSPPPPVAKYNPPATLSPTQKTRIQSISKASAPTIIIPDEFNYDKLAQAEGRKTFRYTTSYKGSFPLNTQSSSLVDPSVPLSPTSSAAPSVPHYPYPTPLSPAASPTSPIFPTSPQSATFSPSNPSSPSMTPSSSTEAITYNSRLSGSSNSISDADWTSRLLDSPNSNIPKSFSVDSHLANAEGQTKRNRAYSVVAHGRSASAQLPFTGPSAVTELIDIDPKVIAEHMTVVDHENLKAIPISELLQKNYIQTREGEEEADEE